MARIKKGFTEQSVTIGSNVFTECPVPLVVNGRPTIVVSPDASGKPSISMDAYDEAGGLIAQIKQGEPQVVSYGYQVCRKGFWRRKTVEVAEVKSGRVVFRSRESHGNPAVEFDAWFEGVHVVATHRQLTIAVAAVGAGLQPVGFSHDIFRRLAVAIQVGRPMPEARGTVAVAVNFGGGSWSDLAALTFRKDRTFGSLHPKGRQFITLKATEYYLRCRFIRCILCPENGTYVDPTCSFTYSVLRVSPEKADKCALNDLCSQAGLWDVSNKESVERQLKKARDQEKELRGPFRAFQLATAGLMGSVVAGLVGLALRDPPFLQGSALGLASGAAVLCIGSILATVVQGFFLMGAWMRLQKALEANNADLCGLWMVWDKSHRNAAKTTYVVGTTSVLGLLLAAISVCLSMPELLGGVPLYLKILALLGGGFIVVVGLVLVSALARTMRHLAEAIGGRYGACQDFLLA